MVGVLRRPSRVYARWNDHFALDYRFLDVLWHPLLLLELGLDELLMVALDKVDLRLHVDVSVPVKPHGAIDRSFLFVLID